MPEDESPQTPENQPTVVVPPTLEQPSKLSGLSKLSGNLLLLVALLIIGGMLFVWKPWQPAIKASDRSVTVTGTAEIKAEPDEYVFSPEYDTVNADKAAALKATTTKTNDVVAQLKTLGVADNKIKTDTSGYKNYYNDNSNTYYSYITVTVDNKTLAQKVQDYLLTTDPTGTVTPQASFSQSKTKQLTNQGRDQATKDAHDKAEQSARNLGFKLGKVISVKDNPDQFRSFDGNISVGANGATAGEDKALSAPIQAGENGFSYTVEVSYSIH
jgi:uncharacterized protein YggE